MSFPDLTRLCIAAAGVVFLVAGSEIIRRHFHFAEEFSRKAVHIGTGVFILFAPKLFQNDGPVLLIAAAFTLLNITAYKAQWLRAVHHTRRISYGTVYYPFSLLLLSFFLWEKHAVLVVASMLTLALGDGAAGVIGESLKLPTEYHITSDKKSVQGSAAMFFGTLSALVLTNVMYPGTLLFGTQTSVWIACIAYISIGVFATGWEAASSRGLDNITVPIFTAIALLVCTSDPDGGNAVQFSTGVLLGALIGFLSYKTRLLQASGAVGAMLLASIIQGLCGWKWTLPIFMFFLLSSLLSKLGKVHKNSYKHVFEKSSTRDIWQVAANGGVGGALALGSFFFSSDVWYIIYLGSIAAVTADTWATELGVFSKKQPILITTFQRVAKGTSGGVSISGSLSVLLGSLIICSTSIPFLNSGAARILVIVVISGAFGSILDSIAGATMQGLYHCNLCGSTTEKTRHCSTPTVLIRGSARINNDVVNTFCALGGAVSSFLLSLL